MKTCNTCKEEKPLADFNKKTSNPGGYERYCKDCHRERNRAHYRANRKDYVASAARYKEKHYEWYDAIKAQATCKSCGENKPWRLTYHHRNPLTKVDEISRMVADTTSKRKILEEMNKCDVLCQNCHADVHYFERNNRAVV